jgi:hypothetical protein
MEYYKDNDNQVYAYESDGSQDAWIKSGLVPITVGEADALRTPAPEEIAAARKAEIDARLTKMDLERSRALSDIALGQYEDFARAKLIDLETERTALATELAGLEQAG